MLRDVLMSSDDEIRGEDRLYYNNTFLSGFVLIFLTEWGDKTQIASAALATQYNAVMVLTGTMVALTLLSILAIYLGKVLSRKIDRKLMAKIAGTVFILMGVSLLFL